MLEPWVKKYMKKLMLTQTSDLAIKRSLIREAIYTEASFLSLAKAAVPVQAFDGIDVKFSYPTEMAGSYPVAENAKAEIGDPMKAVEVEMTLEQGEVRYYMTDHTKLRQLGNYQNSFSRRRAAEKLAELKDSNIIDTIYDGIGNGAAAAAAWDTFPTATAEQIASDITGAIGTIMQNSNMQVHEFRDLVMLVPAEVYGVLLAPMEIENITQSIMKYFSSQHGLKIFPTRYTYDAGSYQSNLDAVLYVSNNKTLIHGVLSKPGAIPLVEEERKLGRGTEYLVRQFFNSVVIPDSASTATSSRIAAITDVRT